MPNPFKKRRRRKVFTASGSNLDLLQQDVTADFEAWTRSPQGQGVDRWKRSQASEYNKVTGVFTHTVTITYTIK